MAAKKYSAGAIFLQVVPVFANVQKAIESEAKNIDRALGDQMEKSGDEAGKRAGKAMSKSMQEEVDKGLKHIDNGLDQIDTRKLGKKLRSEVKGMHEEIARLSDLDLTVDANVDKARAAIAKLEAEFRAMRDRSTIAFKGDTSDVFRGLTAIKTAIAAVDGNIDLDVDTKAVERKMGSFERSLKKTMDKAASHIDGSVNKEVRRLRDELDYLSHLRVGIDIGSTQLKREIGEIRAELEHLSLTNPEIDVRFEAGKAFAELATWEAAVDRADGRTIEVNARVDTHGAERGLLGITRSGDDAANSFRSFNGILLAAAGAGPALVPVLAAIAGGLLAIAPAAAVAGASIGAVLIGFSGIGDAVGALNDQQDNMAKGVAAAAQTERSSAQAVADARRSAARAVESALDQQKAAQERYADSIADVKDAEQALADARSAARGTGGDLNREIQGNSLAIDQALLDSFDATVNYDSVMSDGSATNAEKEQARIDREQALLRLKELRAEQKDLAKEKKKWDKEGVEGTEAVESAQDQLNDAIEAQKDAYQDLGDAAKAVDQARADGARQVAQAMQGQADALDQVDAAQQKVDTAFDKLGLSGQRFALFIHSLRDEFFAFRDDIQSVLLPQVQEAMESFFDSRAAEVGRAALINLADSFGRFTKALSKSFQGQIWTQFFQMLANLGPDIQDAYGNAFISFLEAMASIMTTLAPYALDFAEGFSKLMDAFAGWASSKAGVDAIQRFMEYFEKVGPLVMDLFSSLGDALLNVVISLAPYGEVILKLLTSVLDFIAAMDPKLLGTILSAVLGLITASQVAYAVMNLLMAGAALLTSTVGVVIFALVAIGLAVAYLYHTNADFRDFIQDAWKQISEAFSDAWHDSIKPALMELWEALQDLWDEVLQPLFEWLGPVIVWLAKKIIPLLGKYFGFQIKAIAGLIKHVWIPLIKAMVEIVKWTWKNVLKPTWEAISSAATWLYKKVLKPIFEAISASWATQFKAMKWTWDHVLKPTFDFITNTALPKLKGAFRTVVDAIGSIWGDLKKTVGAPVKFVLDTIINNGLIDGFNKVAGWVGMDGFKHIPIPDSIQQYATGGVLPGYTPGRDPHKFVSPTGGRLELSGGEAIMRPEWTMAMGAENVHRWNSLARSGGVGAVRKAMGVGAYSLGGILPGASISPHSNYGHYAADFNYPGYADYGKAIHAYAKGFTRAFDYGYDNSYGRGVVIDHGTFQTLYAHMSRIAMSAMGRMVNEGQTVGYVGDYGNTGTPPTSHLHFEIGSGWNLPWTSAPGHSDGDYGSAGGGHPTIPGGIMSILKNPLAAVKGWINGGMSKAGQAYSDTPLFNTISKVPLLLAKKVTDKVWDVVPGWAKGAAGWAGKAADWAVGGVKDAASSVGNAVQDGASSVGDFLGLAKGGILPYNGAMMYDSGGYLPPGLTTVVNLTGKPEPVFTNEQWSQMDGTGGQGGTIHYEPHFEGSDLTAEDVAGDLNFQYRRIQRQGKYAGVGDQ